MIWINSQLFFLFLVISLSMVLLLFRTLNSIVTKHSVSEPPREISCAEPAVASYPFALMLADGFLTDFELGVTDDHVKAFATSGKLQLLLRWFKGLMSQNTTFSSLKVWVQAFWDSLKNLILTRRHRKLPPQGGS